MRRRGGASEQEITRRQPSGVPAGTALGNRRGVVVQAARKPKKVKQRYNTDCGLACVASVSHRSYVSVMAEAQALFDWDTDRTRALRTDTSDLRNLLSAFGLTGSRKRHAQSWQQVSDLAIVAVNHNRKTDNWHWVVHYRSQGVSSLMDPNSRLASQWRIASERTKPSFYIEVST